MALTVNTQTRSNGQPSAPLRLAVLNVDLDASYPNPAGYPVPELADQQVIEGPITVISDGTTPLYAQVKADGSLHVYTDDTMAEVANGTNLAAYTGVVVPVWVE